MEPTRRDDGGGGGGDPEEEVLPAPPLSAQWLQQFDPRSQQFYYYDTVTGASQWEQPGDFEDGSAPDPATRGAVAIQSVFRGKRARDAVAATRGCGGKCTNEGGAGDDAGVVAAEAGDGVDNAENGGDCQAPMDEELATAIATAAGDGKGSIATGDDKGAVATGDDAAIDSALAGGGLQLQNKTETSAALSIQCAFRQHAAGRAVETKRSHLRDLTDADVIDRKIADLMRAMDEVQSEIQSRQFVSEQEGDEFPHLRELLASWTAALDALRDRILVLPSQADHVKKIEFTSERLARAQVLHDAMADARSECLALLRGIFLMNSYFLEVDVRRINGATAALQRWKQHELCALADPRIVKVVQLDDLHDIFAHAEAALRRAMGLTDFSAGATTAASKRYEEWHAEVVAALASVRQMEQCLQHKIHLLHVVRMAQVEKRETALMEIEDYESLQLATQQRERTSQAETYANFLAECREGWRKGLEKRQADTREALALENEQREALARKMALVEKMHTRDLHRRSTTKLSIWEAVKEGLPVEIVCTMVFAEMQKARRLGYDFVLRTARSDYGETLIQIACWWGHEHLVAFLLEEGANVHDVDSLCNKFSLLHDVARRGHSQVIRLLLQSGLKHDIVDSSGDTPLHWAARRNHYEAVHTLLEAHMPCAEQNTLDVILKAVRTKNHRGKTPHQVANNACIRRLIQAFDDGRLPLFRRPRAVTVPAGHRRMTDVPPHKNSTSRALLGDLKGSMVRTHSSKNFASPVDAHRSGEHTAPEVEFGIVDVFTPRSKTTVQLQESMQRSK